MPLHFIIFMCAHLAGREAGFGWAPAAWLELALHTQHCNQDNSQLQVTHMMWIPKWVR